MKPKRDVEIWDCYMLPFPFSAVSLCLKNTTSDVWENPYDFLQKHSFLYYFITIIRYAHFGTRKNSLRDWESKGSYSIAAWFFTYVWDKNYICSCLFTH